MIIGCWADTKRESRPTLRGNRSADVLGCERTVNNPNVSQEAKDNAAEVLAEHGVKI